MKDFDPTKQRVLRLKDSTFPNITLGSDRQTLIVRDAHIHAWKVFQNTITLQPSAKMLIIGPSGVGKVSSSEL